MQNTIAAKNINDIITRYYFKQKSLYFQIIFQLSDNGDRMFYKEYDDFYNYKSDFRKLTNQLETKQNIVLDQPIQQLQRVA